jgi:hypothetical protein
MPRPKNGYRLKDGTEVPGTTTFRLVSSGRRASTITATDMNSEYRRTSCAGIWLDTRIDRWFVWSFPMSSDGHRLSSATDYLLGLPTVGLHRRRCAHFDLICRPSLVKAHLFEHQDTRHQ